MQRDEWLITKTEEDEKILCGQWVEQSDVHLWRKKET